MDLYVGNFPANVTISNLLRSLAQDSPSKAAFVFMDSEWNRIVLARQEVWDYSCRFAGQLRRLGIKTGDVVCNYLVNSPQRIITSYGTALAGAIPLHGQLLLADGEDFLHNLKKSNCTTVLVDSKDNGGAKAFVDRIKYKDESTGNERYRGLPSLVNVVYVDVLEDKESEGDNYSRWLEELSKEEMYEYQGAQADDTAWMFVTSGTTGFSKIVPQTHKALISIGIRMCYTCGVFDESAILFNDRSLGWMAGYPICYPCSGCTRILLNNRFPIPADLGNFLWKFFMQEKCDCGFFVPICLNLLMTTLSSEGRRPPFKLRQVGIGGAPVSKQTLGCIGVITDTVGIVYGSTECGVMTWLQVTDKDDYESSCVGRPCPGVEARIVDKNLIDVPVGTVGEIVIRSSTSTKGYVNEPEKNKEAYLEGTLYEPEKNKESFLEDISCKHEKIK